MSKVKLGDIVCRIKDSVDKDNTDLIYYIGGEHFDNRSLTVTRKGIIKGSTIGPAFSTKFKAGDVLLMSRNPHLRKAGIVNFDGICSDVSYIIRTRDENVIMQKFIPILFQSDMFWEFAEKNKKGSTNFFLNWRDFERFEFDLPDIETQQKLCDELWAINDTIDSYKEMIKQSDELIKAKFIEMFGDPLDNSMNWKIQPLKNIVSNDCSLSYGIVQTGNEDINGVPVFRPVDIVNHSPKIEELKKTSKIISDKYKRTILKGRELLITVRANIADTCIVGEDFKGCNVGRGIVPIRTKEDIIILEFLKYQLDNKRFNDHIKRLAKGITLIQLNMEDLREIKIILPPLLLQKQFVIFAKNNNLSIENIGKAETGLKLLYDSIVNAHLIKEEE